MSKLHRVDANNRAFCCPGCRKAHMLPIAGPNAWGWNSDEEHPTFTPSILTWWTAHHEGEDIKHVCHSFVTLGKIMFLADCTHELAGRTVDIPEWEEVWSEQYTAR